MGLLVEDRVIVELKSVESIQPLFKKQTLSYLKLGHWKLGLLMNFNVERIKDGITRIVNGPEEPSQSLRSLRPLRDTTDVDDYCNPA